MQVTFSAVPATHDLVERCARSDRDNPFLSPSYFRAQQQLGLDCWLLAVEEGGQERGAALAVMKRGRLRRSLAIASCPAVSTDSPFWSGVERFCRQQGITDLELSTFASPESSIPQVNGELQRIRRTEFELPLRGGNLFGDLSHHHRARVKKARKHGVLLQRARTAEALREHSALRANSMSRRRARGEDVLATLEGAHANAMLATGAGEIFQAVLAGEVVSSLLILRSESGAYFESAGSSAEGMRVGASHFLVLETAIALQAEGIEIFFLGGARPHEEGLYAYKCGFGPVPVDTELVTAYVGDRIRHRLSRIFESVERALKPHVAD